MIAHPDNLTREFFALGLAPESFQRSDRKSYRGPCPACGGHRRFVIFIDHDFPLWNGFCSCGYELRAWEMVKGMPPVTEEQRHRAEVYQRDRQATEQSRRQTLLSDFTSQELWSELHRRMSEENRRWWRERGIPDKFQDWWSLGYTPGKRFYGENGELVERPAYTIPYWTQGGDFRQRPPVNMYYRLVDPPPGQGKYRTVAGASTFVSRPNLPMNTPIVIVVEGAIKAMAVQCNMKLHADYQCYGLHSCNSFGDVPQWTTGAGRVYILLDPGAEAWAVKLGRKIGRAARIVELPCKPDDMLVKFGATPDDMYRMMLSGRRV